MNYMFWIIGGFVLLYTANRVEAFGDFGATPSDRLPFYFTALAMLIGGLFCFFKGWRGAIAAIKDQFGGKKDVQEPAVETAVPASRMETSQPVSAFDVDEAFDRYMQKRGENPPPAPGEPEPPQDIQPQPRRRTSFGRKST